MRIGVALPAGIPGTELGLLVAWARRAEALGFSHLAAIDRLRYDAHEPLLALAVAASATKHVRLATTVLIGPLRNTAVLAKQAATLDRLSGGRLVLGLGIGARHDDYELARVPHEYRGRQLTAQMEDLRGHWESAELLPAPSRRGGPVLLVGGGTGPAFTRMARLGDGYIHGGGPPRAFERAAQQARAAWIEFERPGAPELWGQGYFGLAADPSPGLAYVRDYYSFTGPFAERLAAGVLTNPQAVAEYARGYLESGCDELSLLPSIARLDELDRLADALAQLL